MDRAHLKEKLSKEIGSYFINVLYLLLFFGVFSLYRTLLMAEYDISYGEYGTIIVKALILAKVIMIGDLAKLGRKIKDKPLILVVFYKTVVFSLWVVLFRVLEVTVLRLFHGESITGVIPELLSKSPYEIAAHGFIVIVAFLPFFILRELSNVIGKQKVLEIFFSRSSGRDD